jgi:hypothetical protein
MTEKKEKPRTETNARFTQEFTDEQFIKAIDKCMENATCSSFEIAEIVGCNPRHAKNRLLQLADQGKIKKKMKGNLWGFRP